MLAVAFMVSSGLASLRARKENIAPEIIINLSFIVLVSGIAGARLFYIFENINYYLKNPLEIIMLSHGGLSWFGGLILAICFGILYLRNKKLPVYKTFDFIAPFVALAQAIGRMGCLLNGCCYGRTIIPIQVYASLILVLIFIILRFLQERPHKEGQIFFTYLLLYSLKRFFIEFWRLDNPIIFTGLTLFQIMSILVFCLSFFKLARILKSGK
jgi:phosphatidylglycerol:prolipoprotein diacylglycerol transferase